MIIEALLLDKILLQSLSLHFFTFSFVGASNLEKIMVHDIDMLVPTYNAHTHVSDVTCI